jgi:hypothetical protein
MFHKFSFLVVKGGRGKTRHAENSTRSSWCESELVDVWVVTRPLRLDRLWERRDNLTKGRILQYLAVFVEGILISQPVCRSVDDATGTGREGAQNAA